MDTKSSFSVVWEFQVKPETRLDFERIYGPSGDWARLFRRSPDYRGTRLFRDIEKSGRYLTFDCWTSPAAVDRFKQDHQADYEALDRRCEPLTDKESQVGEFESLTPSLPE